MADEYGYEKNNPRHQESYWEGRSDPRDKDDKFLAYNSHYYKVIDRQIAADHHERTQQAQGTGSSNASANPGAGKGQGQGQGSGK